MHYFFIFDYESAKIVETGEDLTELQFLQSYTDCNVGSFTVAACSINSD